MRNALALLLIACAHAPPPQPAAPIATPPSPSPSPKPKSAEPSPDSEITSLLKQHRDEIWTCYAAGLSYNPEMTGKVVVEVTAGKVRLVSSTVGSEPVEQCLVDAVATWKIGAGVVVPIVLTRSETW
jgi:hypothetical protein